ncbi:MAG TPA: M48 family metallopeptidase [Candidatus Krumholzibacteriaceae bacterium]|nr:M48 family metallopeptidase [Candidatus Krumholzibacteriaceae bacterium]
MKMIFKSGFRISLMKILPVIFIAVFLFSCATVPLTGRKQVNIIPDSEIHAMSFAQYDEFLKSNRVVEGTEDAGMVKHVGKRIREAVERYFAREGISSRLSGYNWEFNLVDNSQVNAWCMPGGKVVIYSGILPVTETEEGLAVVMGHEIAHAVAEHGSERMSHQMMTQLGGMALSKALEEKPEKTKALFMTAFGIGTQIGAMLPYSRLHESEADHLGLIFMAMAGYNPREAVSFWKRMAAEKSGAAPPEFLSTHPSDEKRVEDLNKLLPEALKYYDK